MSASTLANQATGETSPKNNASITTENSGDSPSPSGSATSRNTVHQENTSKSTVSGELSQTNCYSDTAVGGESLGNKAEVDDDDDDTFSSDASPSICSGGQRGSAGGRVNETPPCTAGGVGGGNGGSGGGSGGGGSGSDGAGGAGGTNGAGGLPGDLNNASTRYKNEVNRRLEEEFDLEATLTAYRDEGKASLKIDPSQFSFDSSLSATRVRDRLIELCGTDVIGMADYTYSTKLRRRLQEENEKKLEKAELQRAEAEKERLRRLMIEGVITADDLRTDPCMLQEYQAHMLKVERDQRRGSFLPSKLKQKVKPRKKLNNTSFLPKNRPMMFNSPDSSNYSQSTIGDKNKDIRYTGLSDNLKLNANQQSCAKVYEPESYISGTPRTINPLLENFKKAENLKDLYGYARKLVVPVQIAPRKKPPPNPQVGFKPKEK